MSFEIIWTELTLVKCEEILPIKPQMIVLSSEKIIHKFSFFLVDFVRKIAPVFYLKTFLTSPEDALF